MIFDPKRPGWAEGFPRRHVSPWFVRLMAITVGIQFIVYALRPLISYEALAAGAGPAELGLVTASFSVLSLLAAVPLGRSVDRWGEVPFLGAGVALIVLATILMLFPANLVLLGVCSATLGLGHLSAIVGAQTLIAKGEAPRTRDVRFATFTTLNSSGQIAGPAVVGLLVGGVGVAAASEGVPNAHRVLLLGMVVGIVVLAVALSLRLRPGALVHRPAAEARPAKASFAAVMRVPSMPTAMLSSLTVLASLDLVAAYLPAYGEANGLSVRTVGFLLATQGVASLVVRLGMLRLIAAFTRRRLLAGSMILSGLGLVLIPTTSHEPALYVIMIVVGLGLGLGQPITLAWVAGQAPREIRGTAMSVRLSGNRLGQTVVPVVVGSIAGAGGLAAAFLSPALLLVVAGALVLRSPRDIEDPTH